jgi:hypothetical protein
MDSRAALTSPDDLSLSFFSRASRADNGVRCWTGSFAYGDGLSTCGALLQHHLGNNGADDPTDAGSPTMKTDMIVEFLRSSRHTRTEGEKGV